MYEVGVSRRASIDPDRMVRFGRMNSPVRTFGRRQMATEAMTTAPAATRAAGFQTLDEEVRLEAVPGAGEVPAWLRGTLVRVTPAMLDVGGRPLRHWFDGLAMLNAFSLGEGGVGYANRYLDTELHR